MAFDDLTRGDSTDMNLTARDAGKMAASENLLFAAHGDVSQQNASDKTAGGDGNVRGFTAADTQAYTSLENQQFAIALIQMNQSRVEAQIANLQAA